MFEALSFIPILAGAARAVVGRGAAKTAEKKAATTAEQDFVHTTEQHAFDEIERHAKERMAQHYPTTTATPATPATMAQEQPIAQNNPAPADTSSSGGSSSGAGSSVLFSLLAVLIIVSAHVVDFFFLNFSIAWFLLIVSSIAMALLLTVFTFVLGSGSVHSFPRNLIKYFIVTVVCLAIVRLIHFSVNGFLPNSPFSDFSALILLFFPPLLFYVVLFDQEFSFNEKIKGFFSFYLFLWMLVLLLFTVASISIPIPDTYAGVDPTQGVANAWSIMWGGILTTFDRLGQEYDDISRRLSPEYYMGQVERGEDDRDLGVRFEDVEPIDPFFLPTQDPVVSGYISAKSFLEDSIFVTTSCQTTGHQEGYAGLPSEPYVEVFQGVDALFDCRFDSINQTGVYPIQVSGTFDYDTWAYIDFDFVFDDKVREFASQGRDIHQELDIIREPRATYTQGPVHIGVGGSRLPIRVIDEAPYLQDAFIGFNIDSRWPRGEINRVHTLELIVPQGFTIGSCNREDVLIEGPEPDENVLDAQGNPLYNKFVFRNPEDSQQAFTSVRCELEMESLDVIPDIIEADKASRTFIVASEYRYTIHEETQIRVQN